MRRAAWLAVPWLSLAVAAEPPLPSASGAMHLGVKNCAQSTCHGAPEPSPYAVVQQNEFATWKKEDKHAQAWKALTTPKAGAIARKLALSAPEQQALCLSCHADPVAPAQRGKEWSASDGVSCETCHGGSGPWLGDHSNGTQTHAANVAAGMFPTDDPRARARLCFSCHLGDGEHSVGHRLLAAGHPRLVIELDTFTSARPAHHVEDADYFKRKPRNEPVATWATGQAQAALSWLDVAQAAAGGGAMFPDFAVFQCDGCHRAMGKGVRGTGVPHLDASHLKLAELVAERAAPDAVAGLAAHRAALERATTAKALGDELAASRASVAQVLAACGARHFDAGDAKAYLQRLAAGARSGEFAQAAVAEQVTYALGTLLAAQEQEQSRPGVSAAMDALYDEAGKLGHFDAERWRKSAAVLADKLGLKAPASN